MKPVMDWLLKKEKPGSRYLALRDLLNLPPGSAELEAARQAAYTAGPIAAVLDQMTPDGYWSKPGPGYGPKYFSTVWALILLGQLGACAQDDERVARAGAYYLDHAFLPDGQITAGGGPSGSVDCLQGNMLAALLQLGVADARLDGAFAWMARTLTGEGLAAKTDKSARLRYYSGKCGPNFACGANKNLPCAWGGAKVMLAFSLLPPARQTDLTRRAVAQGIEFFLSQDPVHAPFPNGWSDKPSQNWWKFGFPVFYVTDLLQVAEALINLGCGQDERLAGLLALIESKQDGQGRWPLEYTYAEKTWGDYGARKDPNPWVTLRALRVLKAAGRWSPE